MSQTSELEFAEALANRDPAAWAAFSETIRPAALRTALGMGASQADAEEAVSACVAKCLDGRFLLAFRGSSSLKGYFCTAVRNAYYDKIRRDKNLPEAARGEDDEDPVANLPAEPGPEAGGSEPGLGGILRDAVQEAFANADPEGILMLRLAHMFGVKQRDLRALWGNCHEATISHRMKDTLREICDRTMRHIAARDPHLQVSWQDVVECCASDEALFGEPD